MRRLAAALAVGVVAGPLAFAGYVSQRVLYPPWHESRTPEQGLPPGRWTDPARDFGLPYRDVEIPGPDGAILRGWFVPARQPALRAAVGMHGGGGDRRAWLSLTPALHGAGYPVLLFDARGHGTSDGAPGFSTWRDLVAALDWLEDTRGLRGAVVLGSSLGASNAVVGAALDPRIAAVVAQSGSTSVQDLLRAQPALAPFPGWLVDLSARAVLLRSGAPWRTVLTLAPTPEDLIARIAPRPVLVIHGSDDEMVPLAHARRLYDAAGEPKALWIVNGAGHRGVRSYAGDAYVERVLELLSQYAPATTGGRP